MKALQHLKLVAVAFLVAALAVTDADARREKKQEASVDFPNATRVDPKPDSSPRLAKDMQRMNDAYGDGDMEKVLQMAGQVLASSRAKPYDIAVAHMFSGFAAYDLGQVDLAIEHMTKAIDTNALPNNNHFSTMHTLASIYAQEEQYDKSIEYLDRYIAETRTDKADVYALKGQIHYNSEQYPQAVEAIKQAMQLQKQNQPASWQQILMASYHEMGDDNAALALAEQLYRDSPEDKQVVLNLVTIYSQLDQSDKAIALMEQARAKGMLTEQRDYEVLYSAYLNTDGGEAKAAEVIKEGLDKGLLPGDARTYTYLGQAYYFSDQVSPAIEAFRKAAAAAADGEPGLYLSQILSNEDRQPEAKAAAQAALAKGLRKPGEAWMIVGRAEFYMDNLPAARAAYQEAMKDPATREQARKALAQISR
ncbi:tetratricopeptide repeat protein [Arenimonas fontis]|uniref:Tetratricopeptide repeat protein n=1 Tax=Arenimonas fontis TaxID=2608255 RepID=A0A5B2Z9Z9_9GAMM|nr:tetratricopeptide repeat protein [Arenimonas fontis]KAA2284041.1 tetratricopeptide repeat protein [Arenimonas fontis]